MGEARAPNEYDGTHSVVKTALRWSSWSHALTFAAFISSKPRSSKLVDE